MTRTGTTDTAAHGTAAEARLAWLTLQDGTFPAGRFVHSNGLECWLAQHRDAGEEDIGRLARAWLAGSVATLDAVVLAHTWRAPERAETYDRLLRTYRMSAAARTASELPGRQLAMAITRIAPGTDRTGYLARVPAGEVPGNLPVVEGLVHRHLGIGLTDAVLGSLRAALAGLFSAAVRLGRLAPLAAQRLLLDSGPSIVELAGVATSTEPADMSATAPELELYAMRHERARARLFTS
ncbi:MULTISPECIES: urease accessory protein UreF [Pseudonocardia]|uniref:Urease accessory protein UreF n=2 Tax=Pseudonocardia TaxID=1847 RepID=A0A1Y2MZU4_PSEAH|nr:MULTISPECIES: urease accessory UreF family protein [Pseudonocardia]OSY40726.1 Urease accessory protein UreF [Pseudonocardia autotrophica]TDN71967.1 urease accessory protein [Pseudonocardia autotrophica]BBG02654.1 urease accessory protein UreF [Pseudonocardia autotrophica]GEC24713.1 urease accessory protein UreF [Pseudonocardia saturnea]